MKKFIFLVPIVLILNCNPAVKENTESFTDASELLKVDKEFSDYSVKYGRNEAFLKYAGDEAVMLKSNAYPLEGIEAIRKTVASVNDLSFVLSWEPMKAFLAKSGELGYTYGTFKLTTKEKVGRGTYVTIWSKKEGEWKFVLDAGNEGLK